MRIAILNWRDLTHPEGGGAERYAVNIATGLVERGHTVTLLCADHGQAPRDEMVDGVRELSDRLLVRRFDKDVVPVDGSAPDADAC